LDNILNGSMRCAEIYTTEQAIYYITDDDNAVYTDTCIVAENEQRVYILVARDGCVAKNIDLTFIVEKSASLRVELLVAHADATIFLRCIMRGESSHAVINGVYILGKNHKMTISTVQHHEAAHTKSNLIIKGVADGNAQVTYSGMVRVEKEARCSISCQDHKAMLLSENARVVSIPSLEVLTNDVHCFHGSAIGAFEQEKLFYAASRGIGQEIIKRLLLQAFFAHLFKNKTMNSLLEGLL